MSSPSKNRGFSLIELMVGIALGLLVVAGVGTIFANNYRTRSETEKTNLQIENGRYATQLLTDEMRMAGYYGELDPTSVTTPSALPDPCDTTTLVSAVALPVQGVDNAAAAPACISDLKTGTDIFVDRRASSCVQGVSGCASGSYVYFQTSLCSTSAGQYLISTSTGNFNNLTAKDCATPADIRSYRTNIYFIANNNQAGDGIPTLKVAELGGNGLFTITPLVAGIDQLQIEYGIDTNGDSIPDVYTSDPGNYNGCTGVACQNYWRNVVTARLYILARNTQPSGGFTDTHVYTAGGNTYGPYNDAYKRHLYTSLVRFNNIAGRLE